MPSRSLLLLLAALGTRATDSLVARALPARGSPQPPVFYNLTIFHVNDIHARLDEFSSSGTDCTAPEKGCYGGYARIKHTVDELRAQTPHSILVNAGDEFQGTLFYTYYHGEKIAETINQLGFDALTIGNHEFDGGDDQLGAFLKNLTFPVVCANIQSTHPDLNATIIPYTIIRQHQLAIIGVTTPDIRDISSPGPGTTFSDPVAAVQATINRLKRREPSVKRIIALTHIGYDKDKILAQQTRGLDAIIGGHSHTLLGNMTGAEGAYPSIATNLDGDDVFIVTAYRWGEYLGKIELSFGSDGKIAGYTGAPIRLVNTTAQDTQLQAQIKAWRQPFDEFAQEVIGESNSVLTNAGCKTGECTLGDVMTDAIVDYRAGSVVGAIINGGGVRATIDVGPVTRGEVITAFPFGNVVVEIDFTGDELWKIFEGIFSGVSQFDGRAVVAGVQISKELRLVYNPSNAVGSRLISLEISGQPVDLTKTYRIGTVDFLARGGDNQMPAQDPAEIVTLDALDEVLLRYIRKKSPITAALEGRISTTS